MSDMSMNDRLAQAKSDHKDAILDESSSTERYKITKKMKKSQGCNTVSNAISFTDRGTGVTFTVSVGVTAYMKDSDNDDLAPDSLKRLQALVTDFVKDIHTKL